MNKTRKVMENVVTIPPSDFPAYQERLQQLLTCHRRIRESRCPVVFSPDSGAKMLAEVLAMPIEQLHPNTDSLMRAIWEAQRGHNWLLFTGGVGRGKSAAMRVVICCIQAATNRQRVMWKSARDLAADKDLQREAKAIDLLVIDDLGTEPTEVVEYGTRTTPLADVIEHRYNHSMPTYMTTNLDGEVLQKHIGARVVSRISEMAGVVKFNDFINQSLR